MFLALSGSYHKFINKDGLVSESGVRNQSKVRLKFLQTFTITTGTWGTKKKLSMTDFRASKS